jgi:hypothetical protein
MSDYISAAYGSPSGLSDWERALLTEAAVEVVMDQLGIDAYEARCLLGDAAEDDELHIIGNAEVVGVWLVGEGWDHPLFVITRAKLREVANRPDP